MKIVILEPIEGGSIPVINYCAESLAQLGHKIIMFRGSIFYPVLQYLKNVICKNADHPAYASLGRFLNDLVIHVISDTMPDMVFGVSQSPFFKHNLSYCTRKGIQTVCWFVEDCNRFVGWKNIAPYCDFFFIIQREPILSHLKGMCKNVEYLPLAANPRIHRPLNLSPAEKVKWGSDVSFVGAGYPNRIELFSRLLPFKLKIWGNDWKLAKNTLLHSKIQESGRRVNPEEYVKIFNASKINLNIHSSMNPLEIGKGDFVNPRTFEIAACRAFQIVDKRLLLHELFAPDELVTFDSADELVSLIKNFLTNDQARQEYASKAYRRAIKEHTYLHRMKTLLEYIERKI